jgi:transposase InsO family protein
VFKEAVARYGKPDMVNTDQGSQFTAQDFVDAVHGASAKLSMDGRGAWGDNVFVERLWTRMLMYDASCTRSCPQASPLDNSAFVQPTDVPT